MKVPLIDLVRHHAPIMDELNEAARRVIASGRYILGPEVKSFEQELADYLGVKHVVGVGNGTDALRLALEAIDIQPGDEVITTPFTFIATAEVIAIACAKPVFVDVEDDTLNINPELIEDAITEKTRAIIPVHLFGQGAKIEKINEIARKHGIAVIEDTAQGIGSERHGKKLGTTGTMGTLSFFPTKNLSALGDAGAVMTNDDRIAEALVMLRIHGADRKYHHIRLGFNSRLDELQAALLRVKLRHIDEWNRRRAEIAAIYTDALKDYVRTPVTDEGNMHIYHQYTIRTEKRDELRQHLADKGVATAIHYPIPLHMQPVFQKLGYREGMFPVAEKAAKEVLSLPVFPEMTDSEINYVIESIIEFFKK